MQMLSFPVRKTVCSGVLSVTPKTFWWRQNDERKKRAQHRNELVKQVLVMVSKKVIL